MLKVYIDAGDGMTALGQVAVWSFALDLWGECTQAADDATALATYARRTGRSDLVVAERIVGPEQVFARDREPATTAEIATTLQLLRGQRGVTIDLIERAAAAGALDAVDEAVVQPGWMGWRTPRTIAQHLVADASGGYLARLGLPTRAFDGPLVDDLRTSADHLQTVLRDLPRDLETEVEGEVWTSVKLLRRQAWHERVEQVFLRRRLRAAGVTFG